MILASPCFSSFGAEATPAAATCEPDGGLQFLCGPRNVEHLVQLGGSHWLIGSGMDGVSSGTASASGHLYLIDPAKKAWQVAFPGPAPSSRQDPALFSGCPGPVNPMNFSAHRLALKARGKGSTASTLRARENPSAPSTNGHLTRQRALGSEHRWSVLGGHLPR